MIDPSTIAITYNFNEYILDFDKDTRIYLIDYRHISTKNSNLVKKQSHFILPNFYGTSRKKCKNLTKITERNKAKL